MPHATLEVSANLRESADLLLETLVASCERSGLFDAAVIMGRAVVHERFRVRQQGASAFASVRLRLRPGRDAGVLAELSRDVVRGIGAILSARGSKEITCVTCEIEEIDVRTRALLLCGGA